MSFASETVLDLWFPDTGFWETTEAFSSWIQCRMYGGMDETICNDFVDLTIAAARGELDHWAETAEGRIALLIALDQFPRSLWRDMPAAYAQDIKANRLVLEGVGNGHFAAIAPWKKLFYIIALFHCEGPDHLDRLTVAERLTEVMAEEMPDQLAHLAEKVRGQNARGRSIIERFGRHPHRNPHFGRVSSQEEETYIATGDFPHVKNEG
ncbi:DUF924 family protein [Loktanella sp. 5RATIMAR09]|uniref:DUF924 family protein n=1 Tax=Loktanella sp. 5RATIMAR09 TaxID=1225655 RepID=UPI0025706C59|nr:DUF924 family protein [Loktanella sp. 5RATIMAR09]